MPTPTTAPGGPLLGPTSREALRAVCRRAVEIARQRRRPVLASWATPLPHTDAVALWRRWRDRADRSLLWESAWDRGSLVAVGAAHVLTGRGTGRIASVRDSWQLLIQDAVAGGRPVVTLPTGQGPLLVGGFSFAPGATARTAPFPDALMWVPTLQLRSSPAPAPTTELRLNAVVHPGDAPDQIAAFLAQLAEHHPPAPPTHRPSEGPPPPRRTPAPPATRHELPSAGAWQDLIRRAVHRIGEGAFEKVVLARELRIVAGTPFDIPAAVERLRHTYPDATLFAVENSGHTFLGATPEYLVRLSGRTVQTLGLAGTAPRGATPEDDAAFERELTDSAKLRHEHDVVVHTLRDALRTSCSRVTAPPSPTVLKLPNVQHLSTAVDGHLGERDAGILEFVERLHPTPALGGHPKAPSLDWLSRHEGLDRGWYAGVVGWTDAAGRGEFAVAIRSALVRADMASLYAGCGIVAGSEPAAEYAESCAKLRPMLHALGVE
ncbi:isochorismate synthase [Streptomyces halobius]|uniref:isochorismate synthase n=1 Tax=Streptomyces halobius TaxID=2879846 RepID=A0ABY4LZM1_9ACTN|nr:isochorismate synthase [Streptomyces halobius]UQA90893.1 isochorismate synthase [Streptomyces halobius]